MLADVEAREASTKDACRTPRRRQQRRGRSLLPVGDQERSNLVKRGRRVEVWFFAQPPHDRFDPCAEGFVVAVAQVIEQRRRRQMLTVLADDGEQRDELCADDRVGFELVGDQRLSRDVGGDVGVAISVAAHPRVQAQGQPHPQRSTEARLKRAQQRLLDIDHRAGEHVDVGEAAFDLVTDGGLTVAQLGGAEDRFDACGDLLARADGAFAAGEVVDAASDRREVRANGAPAHLCGVGGEGEQQRRGRDQLLDLISALARRLQRRQRVVEALFAATGRLASTAHALMLFGEVYQVEVDAKRAHDGLELCRRQRRQPLLDIGGVFAGLSALDEGLAQAFDEIEGGVAALFAYDVAEDRAEVSDVVLQCSCRHHDGLTVHPSAGGQMPFAVLLRDRAVMCFAAGVLSHSGCADVDSGPVDPLVARCGAAIVFSLCAFRLRRDQKPPGRGFWTSGPCVHASVVTPCPRRGMSPGCRAAGRCRRRGRRRPPLLRAGGAS